MSHSVNVACIQVEADDAATKELQLERVAEVVGGFRREVDLVVLPELWASGYFAFDAYEEDAEGLDGPLVRGLRRLARQESTWIHGGSLVERAPDDSLYNTSILIDRRGSIVHRYRKSHIFGNDSRERQLIRAGRQIGVVSTDHGTVGMTTCYDLRFPELYRHLVRVGGAELLVVVAAWPQRRTDHWRVLLRARAVESQAFVIACNGGGVDHGTQLAGASMIVDPWGDVVACSGGGAAVLRHTIDVDLVQETRQRFPVLDHGWLSVPLADSLSPTVPVAEEST